MVLPFPVKKGLDISKMFQSQSDEALDILKDMPCDDLYRIRNWLSDMPLLMGDIIPDLGELAREVNVHLSSSDCPPRTFESHPAVSVIDPNELKMGIEVEKEHKPTIERIKGYMRINGTMPPNEMIYQWIAWDHFPECGTYYSRLLQMEKECKTEEK